jgi:hypothetical protein
MKLNTRFFSHALLFFPLILFSVQAAGITRGQAVRDCQCKAGLFEDEWTVQVKKGDWIEETCKSSDSGIECGTLYGPGGTTCPASCVVLKEQGPLGREEWKTVLKDPLTLKMREQYVKTVPKKILDAIVKKHPDWLPTVYSEVAPYIIKLKSNEPFYFEAKAISIVYYFSDLDHFLSKQWNWSFWLTETAELLHESTAPYPIFESGYVNGPCLAPAGKNLDRVVLSGSMAGPSDAASCCGPYVLDELKSKGPVLLPTEGRDETNYPSDVIYNKCSDKIDTNTFRRIDGPANLREYGKSIDPPSPDKSKVIGSCADKAPVIDLGSRGEWHHVFCEGKSGWTHKKNLR